MNVMINESKFLIIWVFFNFNKRLFKVTVQLDLTSMGVNTVAGTKSTPHTQLWNMLL